MDTEDTNGSAMRLGWYAAIATTVLTIVTFGIALFTPPLSGPNCPANCYSYPYTDVASRFPRDYIWMYPAILLSLVSFVLLACLHHVAPEEKRVFSQVGLSFALVSMAVLVVDYVLQVSVIQASLAQGETEGIALLTQFNPHGVFIVLEEIGFTMLGLALLCMAPTVTGATRVDRWIRWIFVASFVLIVMALAGYSFAYGIEREYRFEVAAISITWLALIASGPLLSIRFRRLRRLA